MKISACYIVKNDEAVLKKSLESIKNSVDEIIVVDTGAEDGTRKVAESYGARLSDFAWCDDFAAARNAALAQATGDFVVFLDADEYFSATTKNNLRRVIEKNRTAEAIGIDLVNIDQETEETLGDAFALRIFKNDKNFRFAGRIHEQLVRKDGRPPEMAFVPPQELLILHTGYSRSLSAQKAERNYRMLMRELETDEHPERLYMYLAEACMGLKRSSEAKKWALMDIAGGRKQVAYASRSYRILIKLLNESAGAYEEKQELLERATADFPEVPEFWAELAEVQAAVFDYEAAKASMKKAIAGAGKPVGLEPTQFGEQGVKTARERLSFWERILERARSIRISACLIFRDDRKDIGKWLKGAQVFADETICVDTGSADGSAELCEAAGVTPYRFAWCDDFAAARNFALEKATGDYIVFLDADEYFARPERVRFLLAEAEIRKLKVDAFMIPLINIDEDDSGREMQRFMAVRIFRNAESIRYTGRIHEQIEKTDGQLEIKADNRLEIFHTGYSSARIKKKLERNLALLEAEIAEKGEQPQFYRYLAECHFGLGHFEKALHYGLLASEVAIKMPGSDSMGEQVVIQAMQELEKPVPERLAFIRKAAEKYPGLPDFFAQEGIIRYETGDKEGAYGPLQKAVDIFENTDGSFEASRFNNMADRVYFYLAGQVREKGDVAEAVRLARKALSCNFYFKKALNLYYELKAPQNLPEAVEILTEIYGLGEAEFLCAWAEERSDWELYDYYAAALKRQGKKDGLERLHELRKKGKVMELYRGTILQIAADMQLLMVLLLQMEKAFPEKRDFLTEKKRQLPLSLQRIMAACRGERTGLLPEDEGIYISLLPKVISNGDDELLRQYVTVAAGVSPELAVKTAKILQDNMYWAEALSLYQVVPADSAVVTGDFWYGAGLCLYYLHEAENARAAFMRAKAEGCGGKDIEAYLQWIDEGYCHG